MELVGPLASVLRESQNVLLCGCGGGSDVLGCVPVYFALQSAFPDLTVHLASLTDADRSLKDRKIFNDLFTTYPKEHLRPVTETSWEVRYCTEEKRASKDTGCSFPAKDPFPNRYFPEHTLSRWFAESTSRDVPVYAISQRQGTKGIHEAYQKICQDLRIDTILLMDVGIDSVMFGFEPHLGTPLQDMMSLAAIEKLRVPHKVLICFGLGLEPIGEVNFFHNLSVLQADKAFLGSSCLVAHTPLADHYSGAVEFCGNSSLNGAILESLKGNFLRGMQQVQPLSQLMWFFHLPAVTKRVHYLPLLRDLESFVAVQDAIEAWRATHVAKKQEQPYQGGMWGHVMSNGANNKHGGEDVRFNWSHPWPRGYPKTK